MGLGILSQAQLEDNEELKIKQLQKHEANLSKVAWNLRPIKKWASFTEGSWVPLQRWHLCPVCDVLPVRGRWLLLWGPLGFSRLQNERGRAQGWQGCPRSEGCSQGCPRDTRAKPQCLLLSRKSRSCPRARLKKRVRGWWQPCLQTFLFLPPTLLFQPPP